MDITQFVVSRREKGLLSGDYNAYRRQLSRRLLVVRRRLGCTTPKGKKAQPKKYITAEEIEKNPEYVHLSLLHSERAWARGMHERSRIAAEATGRPATRTMRQHAIAKFYKSTVYAHNLIDCLELIEVSEATRIHILEARAYYVYLMGGLAFEKKRWNDCLVHLAEARLMYTFLSMTKAAKKADMFQELVTSDIDPNLRYAGYQSKIPRSTSIDKIMRSQIQEHKNKYVEDILKEQPDILTDNFDREGKKTESGHVVEIPRTIRWRTRTVNLEDAATAAALAQMISAERKVSSHINKTAKMSAKAKAAAFDDILIPSQDAVDATKTAIEELSTEWVPQSDSRMQALQITRTAVNYSLLNWRIGRNRILLGKQDGSILASPRPGPTKKKRPAGKSQRKSSKPNPESVVTNVIESDSHKLRRLRERLVLYDATLQTIDSIPQLPGVAADQPFTTLINAKRSYVSALRCLSISRSHSIVGNPQNALALLVRSNEHNTQAIEAFSSTSLPSPPVQIPNSEISSPDLPTLDTLAIHDAETLHQLLEHEILAQRGLVVLKTAIPLTFRKINPTRTEPDKKQSPTSPPLVERLSSDLILNTTSPRDPLHIDLANLVTYPPALQPIPVKPIFLDVAYNYIEYPSQNTRARKATSAQNAKADVDATKADAQAPLPASQQPEQTAGRRGWFGFGR